MSAAGVPAGSPPGLGRPDDASLPPHGAESTGVAMTAAPGGPTFAQLWHEAVQASSGRIFLVWEEADGATCSWTYREFDDLVATVRGALSAAGVGRGAAVHLWLGNCPAFVALWLAATTLGAHIVPSDPSASERELHDAMRRTRPVVGICREDAAPLYRRVAEHYSVTVVPVATESVDLRELGGGSDDVGGRDAAPSDIAPSDIAAIMFTSGTTSRPKGVVVTQRNYAFVGELMAAASGLTPRDTQLVALPLFHANAQYYSIAPAIAVGARVVLLARFSASSYVRQLAKHEVTHASLFAAPMRMILSRTDHDDQAAGTTLRNVWFAQNLDVSEYEAIARLLGCKPRQLYGMTETIAPVLTSDWRVDSHSTMGRTTAGCRVEILDEQAGTAAVGEVGELAVVGDPGVSLFAGYLDDPEATASAFRDRYFMTGDYAWCDDTGRIHFAGRDSERIKVAGENVSLVEIESVLLAHAGVVDAAVVARPDAIRDQVPAAFVVAATAGGVTVDELQDHCRRHLSKSKRPQEYHLVDELPRTSVGKVKKSQLRPRKDAHATRDREGD